MTLLLIIIIYLAFISLGLPDSLLGTAWPVMQLELTLPMEAAGILSMTIASGTIVSSLISGRLLKRFGTGKVTSVSVFMTACALLGFYFAPSILWLIVCAIPLGLGAGAVDTGLNDYVAVNYKAHHMSWLHSFWGVGASLSPIIMSQFILHDNAWREGYLTIAIIQFGLVLVLFLSLPLWRKVANQDASLINDAIEAEATLASTDTKPLKIKGVKFALITFLFYCGLEAGVGLWGSSFLVNMKSFDPAIAARWVSFYYAGITIGRFVTGFVTFKISNKTLIRTGQITALIGTIMLFLPLPSVFLMSSFVIIGLGLAPIFPCMIHETPVSFGKQHSQILIGYQMAAAYTGTTFIPPLIGLIASRASIGIFPFIAILLAIGMLISSERLNKIITRKPNV